MQDDCAGGKTDYAAPRTQDILLKISRLQGSIRCFSGWSKVLDKHTLFHIVEIFEIILGYYCQSKQLRKVLIRCYGHALLLR